MKRIDKGGQFVSGAGSVLRVAPNKPGTKKLTATMKRRALKVRKSERQRASSS
ncbi:hypothetical protein QMZ05_28415 [Bradyrhizobium sp. INPA03-11B]|uniref:hypothetical protein n=1 Tax=Bradyrhizobium sp. INPA03-11B TaxID=418598 RepID=UPI00338DF6E0